MGKSTGYTGCSLNKHRFFPVSEETGEDWVLVKQQCFDCGKERVLIKAHYKVNAREVHND